MPGETYPENPAKKGNPGPGKKIKTEVTITAVENGFIVECRYQVERKGQDYPNWENKKFIAETEVDARALINKHLGELKSGNSGY